MIICRQCQISLPSGAKCGPVLMKTQNVFGNDGKNKLVISEDAIQIRPE